MTMDAEIARARRVAQSLRESAAKELKTNPRAMLGACVLIVLAALSVAFQLSSWADARLADARQHRIEAEALQEASGLDAAVFADLASSFEQQLSDARARFWTGDTASVAQAGLRQWLARAAADAGLESLRLEGGEVLPVAALPGVQEVTVMALSGPRNEEVTPAAVRALLAQIAAEPRFMRVSLLDLTFEPNARLRLAVSVYYAEDGGQGAP
jgi:hypothetical protein